MNFHVRIVKQNCKPSLIGAGCAVFAQRKIPRSRAKFHPKAANGSAKRDENRIIADRKLLKTNFASPQILASTEPMQNSISCRAPHMENSPPAKPARLRVLKRIRREMDAASNKVGQLAPHRLPKYSPSTPLVPAKETTR